MQSHPRATTRRVTIVDEWALVPMPPELWSSFADAAASRGCRIPQLLDDTPQVAKAPIAGSVLAPSSDADERLRLIAERYLDPATGDDADFLAWLDGALRKPLSELAPTSASPA